MIRVTFHLDNSQDYTSYLIVGPEQAIPAGKVDDGMIEGFFRAGDDVFGSGIKAENLMTGDGRAAFERFLVERSQDVSDDDPEGTEMSVQIASRNRKAAVVIPLRVISDLTAIRWSDQGRQ